MWAEADDETDSLTLFNLLEKDGKPQIFSRDWISSVSYTAIVWFCEAFSEAVVEESKINFWLIIS